jgi:hypothetical protein
VRKSLNKSGPAHTRNVQRSKSRVSMMYSKLRRGLVYWFVIETHRRPNRESARAMSMVDEESIKTMEEGAVLFAETQPLSLFPSIRLVTKRPTDGLANSVAHAQIRHRTSTFTVPLSAHVLVSLRTLGLFLHSYYVTTLPFFDLSLISFLYLLSVHRRHPALPHHWS